MSPIDSFQWSNPSFKKRRLRHPGPVDTVNRIVNVLPLQISASRLRNVHAFPFGKPALTTEVVSGSFEASNYTLP